MSVPVTLWSYALPIDQLTHAWLNELIGTDADWSVQPMTLAEVTCETSARRSGLSDTSDTISVAVKYPTRTRSILEIIGGNDRTISRTCDPVGLGQTLQLDEEPIYWRTLPHQGRSGTDGRPIIAASKRGRDQGQQSPCGATLGTFRTADQ